MESISYHEKSAVHLLAKQCHRVNLCPEKNPANLAKQQLLKQQILFEKCTHCIKEQEVTSNYQWLSDLDEVKGLTVGATYQNIKACSTFTKCNATTTQSQVADKLTEAKFVTVKLKDDYNGWKEAVLFHHSKTSHFIWNIAALQSTVKLNYSYSSFLFLVQK